MTKLLSAKRVAISVGLYAVAFGLAARVVPWFIWIPMAAALVIVHVYVDERRRFRRYREVFRGVKATQVEGFPLLRAVPNRPVDDVIFDGLHEITAELEKKCYQLVEKNIQLLSLKEISLSIISSLDEARIVDSVRSFLSKGLGFKEIFVCIYASDIDAFRIYTLREAYGESAHDELTVPLGQMDGLLRKSVVNRKAVLIKDPAMHPIGSVAGTNLFGDSTMDSYLIVPMVKSKYSQDCWKAPDCLLKTGGTRASGVAQPPNNGVGLEDGGPEFDGVCQECGRLPVLGAIGVTDGFKAGSLSQVDLVSVETLALQISTLLENSQLYNELKKEESFRHNVINSMMNGLITVDMEGRVLLANEPAQDITGYRGDELEGLSIDQLIIEGSAEVTVSPVRSALKNGQKIFQQEAWLVKKDGKKLPIMLNISFLYDEYRELQGALAVFLDITRIKHMEAKILHLDKLAALGRFSSSMAHEIRNPLTGIVAGLEYLKRVGSIPTTQNENISFILGEVNRIDRLITDILSVVRIGDLVYHPVHIESLIVNSITTIGDFAQKRSVVIRTDFPQESRTIMIDSDRITQVLINLLKNAIEASPPNGEIRVRVSFPVDTSDVLFDEIRNLVIIEIEDHGVGFRDEEKGRIFEPFFTTKTDGTGLGLYVTHSIVERHGGYIFVESEQDKGTIFTVYLPVEKVEHGDSSQVSHPLGR